MKHNKIIVVYALVFLVACNNNVAINYPSCNVDLSNLNTQIKIAYSDQWNTYKVGDPVEIIVISQIPFVYAANPDFDVELYAYDDNANQWNAVEDKVIQLGDEVLFFSEGENGFSTLFPDLIPDQQDVQIYFCIYGYLVENGVISSTKIGASSSFILHND